MCRSGALVFQYGSFIPHSKEYHWSQLKFTILKMKLCDTEKLTSCDKWNPPRGGKQKLNTRRFSGARSSYDDVKDDGFAITRNKTIMKLYSNVVKIHMNLVEKIRLITEVPTHYFSQLKKIHLKIPYQNDLHTKRDLSKIYPYFPIIESFISFDSSFLRFPKNRPSSM